VEHNECLIIGPIFYTDTTNSDRYEKLILMEFLEQFKKKANHTHGFNSSQQMAIPQMTL
jgi:hypothetical protein